MVACTTDVVRHPQVWSSRALFVHLLHKTIILPRQARDKHRESSTQKQTVVLHSEDVYNATKTYDLEHICSAALGGKVGSAAYGGATTLCEDEKKKGVKVPCMFFSLSFPYVCPERVLAK